MNPSALNDRPQADHGGPLRVRELLARVAGHHLSLARYFHELACANVDPLSSFATLVRWRHASVAAELEHHAARQGCLALDGCLREAPDQRVLELLAAAPELDAPSRVIVDYAFELERAFEGIFDELQANARAAGLRAIITELATLELGVAERLDAARLELGYGS
ncbi:MAG: hypothetical protein R6X02_05705 [Enhygromyxa sp.]